jgi:hypothetical protein
VKQLVIQAKLWQQLVLKIGGVAQPRHRRLTNQPDVSKIDGARPPSTLGELALNPLDDRRGKDRLGDLPSSGLNVLHHATRSDRPHSVDVPEILRCRRHHGGYGPRRHAS